MNILQNLTVSKEQTIPLFDLPEPTLLRTYDEGKWSIKQILVHLADAESVLLERIKRIIAEPRQVLWAFNQDLWNEKLNYPDFPLQLSRVQYIANREIVIFLADRFYEHFGHLEFIHSETGLRTLRDEFDKVARHNFHHLDQIQQALKKS